MGDEQAYDLETLLLQIREIIDTARTMPMSASVLVNREETLEIVDDALRSLPEELRHARWLLKEREEYLAQARRDAEDIVEAARVQAERMVERTEVAREARRVAQQVVSHAEADSRRLRHEAEDYIDQKLASFEVVLERTMQTVQRGREQLQAVVGPMPADPAVETLPAHRRIRPFRPGRPLTGELATEPPNWPGCYPHVRLPGILGAILRTVAPRRNVPGRPGRPSRNLLTKR